jgi:hypothetical protein
MQSQPQHNLQSVLVGVQYQTHFRFLARTLFGLEGIYQIEEWMTQWEVLVQCRGTIEAILRLVTIEIDV